MTAKPGDGCAICGFNIKTAMCTHPWDTPFQAWPAPYIEQLRRLLSPDPSPWS